MKFWVTLTSIVLTLVIGAGVFVSNTQTTEAALDPTAFKESPCNEGFELTIAIQPVQDSGNISAIKTQQEPSGFYVAAGKDGNGTAMRLTDKEDVHSFSKKRCSVWEKFTWPKLQSVIFENGLKERSNFECINVAELKYRVGNKKYASKLCLGSAGADSMSYGFREFYRGTEYLAW